MTFSDVIFLAGPLGALVLVPVAVVTLAVRRPRWGARVAAPLLVAVVVSWLAYWLYWGRAFELADAYQPVPTSLAARSELWAAATAAFVVALIGAAASSLAQGQRR